MFTKQFAQYFQKKQQWQLQDEYFQRKTALYVAFLGLSELSIDGEDRIHRNKDLEGRNEQNICLLSEDLSPKVSLGSGCRASDQNASQKEISLHAASLEQTTTTRKHHTNRRPIFAQPSPEHQRSPGAASGRYTKGLSSQTLSKPFHLKEKMTKRMVLLMMLCFSLGWLMSHTEGMLVGSHFCSFNGSTCNFFCLGNNVHEMPKHIPENTTFV